MKRLNKQNLTVKLLNNGLDVKKTEKLTNIKDEIRCYVVNFLVK